MIVELEHKALLSREVDIFIESIKQRQEEKITKTTVEIENFSYGQALVKPQPGESLLSWIIRQAHEFKLTAQEFLKSEMLFWKKIHNIELFDTCFSRRNWGWINKLDILPLGDQFRDLIRKRGLDSNIDDLQVNFLKDFNQFVFKLPWGVQFRFYRIDLTYCGICWSDVSTRYFRWEWRLPFVLVCLDHGVTLKSKCFSCGEYLFGNQKWKRNVKKNKFTCLKTCSSCGIQLNFQVKKNQLRENPKYTKLQKEIYHGLKSNQSWSTIDGYECFIDSINYARKSSKITNIMDRLYLMKHLLDYNFDAEKKYLCAYCGERFDPKDRHYIDKKCIEKRICQICRRDYSKKTKVCFRNHVWGCGVDRICSECGMNYINKSKYSYNRHIWGCNKDRYCEICGKNYRDKTKWNYDIHVKKCIMLGYIVKI